MATCEDVIPVTIGQIIEVVLEEGLSCLLKITDLGSEEVCERLLVGRYLITDGVSIPL